MKALRKVREMRSKRVPDRVHVVRPPENDGQASRDGTSIEIVRMLAQISDKLKRSEAERYELLNELREYRKSLRELEDKAENSEKAYLTIENKLHSKGSVDTESLQRQVKFEKTLKATEEKMVKAIAGQALIDKRLKDTEDKQAVIDQRLDQSVSEQAKIDRQLEIASQDKSRLMRKVERLEEMVTDTQDTLRAKAMVLLTDQSASAQGALKAPAWGAGSPDENAAEQSERSWWQKLVNVQAIGMISLIVAALMIGWMINQVQRPAVPEITIPDSADLTGFDAQVEPPSSSVSDVTNLEEQKLTERLSGSSQVVMTPDETPENVLDYSDDQLLAALNSDPEKLAGKLNDIDVSSAPAAAETKQPADTKSSFVVDPQITAPMRDFEKLAFVQNPKIEKAVMAEKNSAPIADRIKADSSLSDAVKNIEKQAFAGNAEAQHDLAAIYTAGHGGVNQNFDKAAFWFREASDNGIANARYNLGVLYHQGLGQERDLSRALYWYREAAKLDHAEAQYNLGIAHIEGIGTNYDPRLAAAFFERAANNGIMEAAYNLGLIYENGLLGETKPDEALLWYKIASDQGSPEAKSAMEQLAKDLQIGMDDVNNLVNRMQQINKSVKGRVAGPESNTQSDASNVSINSKQAMIAQIQEYLMLTGAYSGPADGINGPQTEEAIKTYQAANNLPVDGQVSSDLLNSMVGGAIERLNQ